MNAKYVKWEAVGNDILLLSRVNGKKLWETISDFKYYFYIKTDDYKKFTFEDWEKFIRVHKKWGIDFVYGDEWIKVYINNNADRRAKFKLFDDLTAMRIKVYEGDLNNAKRYAIDNDLKLTTEYHYCFYDIETDDSKEGIEVGRDRIVSFAYVDHTGKKFFFCHDEEVEILKEIEKMFKEYDVCLGYNSKEFDLPYIKARMELYPDDFPRLDEIIREFIHLDMLKIIKKMFGGFLKIRFKLDSIATYFLGRGKVKHGKSIKELFDTDRTTLEEYNIEDCKLLYDLNEKLKIFDIVNLQCEMSGCPMSTFWVGEILDYFYLRAANKENIHLPTAYKLENNEKVEGGYVYPGEPCWLNDPTKKYLILDFSSLYPNIIKTFNISIDVMRETKREGVEYFTTPNGAHFLKNRKGVVTKQIEKLLDLKNHYSKVKKQATYGSVEYNAAHAKRVVVKELANSSYGVLAQQNGRFYTKKGAEAITLTGQFITKGTIMFAQQLGYNTLMGDTDSVAIEVPRDTNTDELLQKFQEYYANVLKQYNVDTHYLSLELDKQLTNFCVLAKKNYMGLLEVIDGKDVTELPVRKRILVKGIGVVKKSATEYSKEMLWELMERILHKNQTCNQIFDWLWKARNEFMTGKIDTEKIIIRKTVSRPLESYEGEMMDKQGKTKRKKDGTIRMKSIPLHVKIAMKMKEQHKEFYVGDMIEYIVIDGKSPAEGIHISDFKGEFDKAYYWDKQIWSEMERILDVVFPETSQICKVKKETKKKTTVEEKPMTWYDFRFKRKKSEGVLIYES